MSRLADLRILLDRDGVVRLSRDGRALALPVSADLAASLRTLADRLDAISWATGCTTFEALLAPVLITGEAPLTTPRPMPRTRARGHRCRSTTTTMGT